MATTDDVIKSGVIFRVLAAVNPVTWNRISFWTLASDVYFLDDTSAEETKSLIDKTENIDGITSDVSANSDKIAASSELVNGINNPCPITITTSQWSSSTIEVNGGNYYRYVAQVNKVWTAYPIVILAPVNDTYPIPSATETQEFNRIAHVYTDTTENTVTFLATQKPNANLKIIVKGVE